jgi:hypothetical protein
MGIRRRSDRSLRRRPGNERQKKTVAVLCQGETEICYFDALVRFLGLQNHCDVPKAGLRLAPSGVLKQAKKILQDEVDMVICVFDRDTFTCFDRTRAEIARNSQRLVDGSSDPCIEVWLSLHFEVFTADLSAAHTIRHFSDNHCPGYRKGTSDAIANLVRRVQIAIENGESLEAHNNATGATTPATRLHKVVPILPTLAEN